jgi:hypothetical protein
MHETGWTLTEAERAALGAALDALLPPAGSFPAPSATGMIDDFILRRVPPAGDGSVPYPWVDSDGLKSLLAHLTGEPDMTAALRRLEAERPADFAILWRLAVFGYYSRPETIVAIARDHAPAYHGAPLPLGYDHAIGRWDPDDPYQLPRIPRGAYIATDAVRRVEIERLPREERA